MHFVDTNDPQKAREEQHRAFLNIMSEARGPKYLESVYLFGTPEEIVASLQARVDVGVRYIILHTMTPDIAQLDWWVKEIIPTLSFPRCPRTLEPLCEPSRRARRPAAAAASLAGDARRCL